MLLWIIDLFKKYELNACLVAVLKSLRKEGENVYKLEKWFEGIYDDLGDLKEKSERVRTVSSICLGLWDKLIFRIWAEKLKEESLKGSEDIENSPDNDNSNSYTHFLPLKAVSSIQGHLD